MSTKEIENKAKRLKLLKNRQESLQQEIDQLEADLKAQLERGRAAGDRQWRKFRRMRGHPKGSGCGRNAAATIEDADTSRTQAQKATPPAAGSSRNPRA